MPGSNHGPSIKNPRVYEALRRHRGMSKRRVAMISNAQRHKDSGTANLAIPPHGPDALFNQPSMAQRRRRKRTKAANWGAHVGQAIAGRLRRGEGGRFTGDGQVSAAPKPSASRERRAALRDARRKRLDDIRAAREAERKVEATKRAEEDAYIAAGKTGHARQLRRAEVAQARRDRATERKAVHQRELEEERETRRKEDEDEQRKQEEEKPKKGGGGGGGKKKPTDEEKRSAADQKKASNRAATAPKAGLSTEEAEWLAGVASGTPPAGSFDGRHLAELGLTQDAGDTTEATDAGRRALAALERGDVRGALAAIQDGKAKLARDRARAEQRRQRDVAKRQREAKRRKKRLPRGPVRQTAKAQRTFGGTKRADLADSVFAGPDRSFPIKTAQDVRDAVRSLGRTKHDKAAVKRGIIRRARAIGAVDALPESWRTEKAGRTVFGDGTAVATPAVVRGIPAPVGSIPSSFSVFKDAPPWAQAIAARFDVLEATIKAQSDEEKAMFANMGGGRSGGGGKGGKSTLWPKGPSGKRTPQAAAAQGSSGASKPKSAPRELTSGEKSQIESRERSIAQSQELIDKAQKKIDRQNRPGVRKLSPDTLMDYKRIIRENKRYIEEDQKRIDTIRASAKEGH